MTYDELIQYLNDKYGINFAWPSCVNVSHETYANVCQRIFEIKLNSQRLGQRLNRAGCKLSIAVGPHGGILLRGAELIIDSISGV